MPKYRPEDVNLRTALYKDGDPYSERICPTLGEAAIEVKKSLVEERSGEGAFQNCG
jgi:hypothetical protein